MSVQYQADDTVFKLAATVDFEVSCSHVGVKVLSCFQAIVLLTVCKMCQHDQRAYGMLNDCCTGLSDVSQM